MRIVRYSKGWRIQSSTDYKVQNEIVKAIEKTYQPETDAQKEVVIDTARAIINGAYHIELGDNILTISVGTGSSNIELEYTDAIALEF